MVSSIFVKDAKILRNKGYQIRKFRKRFVRKLEDLSFFETKVSRNDFFLNRPFGGVKTSQISANGSREVRKCMKQHGF